MGAFSITILMIISFILGALFEHFRIWNKFSNDFKDLQNKVKVDLEKNNNNK